VVPSGDCILFSLSIETDWVLLKTLTTYSSRQLAEFWSGVAIVIVIVGGRRL